MRTTFVGTPAKHPAAGGVALVLGGGGGPGLAYLVGALRAVEERLSVRNSDLVIGTSAGAIVAAQLRIGLSYEQILGEPAADGGRSVLTPAWTSRPDLLRRGVAAGYTSLRALSRIPMPRVPESLRQAHPNALFAAPSWRPEDIGSAWPDHPLWLVASDLDSGQRIVICGSSHRHEGMALDRAVQASCSVPGIYPPTRFGPRQLVDGGVHSAANLDLAARVRPQVVIAIVPMAVEEPVDATQPRPSAVRRYIAWRTAREVRRLHRRGTHVLLLRPGAADLAGAERNLFSRQNSESLAGVAYDRTVAQLHDQRNAMAMATAGELLGT